MWSMSGKYNIYHACLVTASSMFYSGEMIKEAYYIITFNRYRFT